VRCDRIDKVRKAFLELHGIGLFQNLINKRTCDKDASIQKVKQVLDVFVMRVSEQADLARRA
jgi:hypothetical protein